jgi:hypothetical protein
MESYDYWNLPLSSSYDTYIAIVGVDQIDRGVGEASAQFPNAFGIN